MCKRVDPTSGLIGRDLVVTVFSNVRSLFCLPAYIADISVLQLIKLVFEQRTQILLPRLHTIDAELSRKLPSEDRLTNAVHTKLIAACKKWSKHCMNVHHTIPSPELSVRMMAERPFTIGAHPYKVTNSQIAYGLELASFNWLARISNMTPTWKRYTDSLHHQAIIDKGLEDALYTPYPSLLLFHKQAFDIIRAVPGLAGFPSWGRVPPLTSREMDELVAETEYNDEAVADASRSLRKAELQRDLNSHIGRFLSFLARPGRVGVEIKGDNDDGNDDEAEEEDEEPEHGRKRIFALHPSLKEPVYQLWRVSFSI
jgi:hypothetical protein